MKAGFSAGLQGQQFRVMTFGGVWTRGIVLAVVLAVSTPLRGLGGLAAMAQNAPDTSANAADRATLRDTEVRGVTLRGVVLDSSGAAIAGAAITARPEQFPEYASEEAIEPNASGASSTVSDSNGEFTLRLAPGRYALRASAEGFQEHSRIVAVTAVAADSTGLSTPTATISATPAAALANEPIVENMLVIILAIAPHSETVLVSEMTEYLSPTIGSATKTLTPLRDVPQSITVVTRELIRDQAMQNLGDVVRYVPGIAYHQGENNRDDVVIRGNRSSADFFVNGIRDDVQYYRDLYDLERVEALKGPNAMIFGRGGAGGVINRITKEAAFAPLHEITLQGGSHGNKRMTADFNQPLGDQLALRINGMAEDSGSFRNFVGLARTGISPALAYMPSQRTKITFGYEHFRDRRTADRGITSFEGRPANVPIETFYGDPKQSKVRATINLGTAAIDHQAGRLGIRNRMQAGGYDRFYQNYVPGTATADRQFVALTAYNNSTARFNIFNQTDVTYRLSTGPMHHTLLGGTELGRQVTDNFRQSGFFHNTSSSILAPFFNPTIDTPITFRQNSSDADNHLRARVTATYLQDQIAVSRYVQVIAGVRFDRFELRYQNNRTTNSNNAILDRVDHLVSPRAGIVVKPVEPLSLYGNYSVSYLPSSGDQFSALTTITQQVKPEKFTNYEAGAKWDIHRALSLTTAVYRLNRTNTRATDSNDPTRIVQTGSQRSNGFEVGLAGNVTSNWKIAGGLAWQDAFVTSATTAARAGAQVGQVPHHTFSLWNNYRIIPRIAVALGIHHRGDMFAAIDNTVVLPGYTRADGAVFVSLTERVRLQTNIENLFNAVTFANADSNTNISPGAPRAVRVGLIARF
ncbi:MAG: TonB-dependent siderophore receptor [Acidobacteria bacterium]|nr:TonB-dependent siderophore receptor [Acidobacteriota bacterium]